MLYVDVSYGVGSCAHVTLHYAWGGGWCAGTRREGMVYEEGGDGGWE